MSYQSTPFQACIRAKLIDFVSKDTAFYRVNITKSYKDNSIGAIISVSHDIMTYNSRFVVSRTTKRGGKQIFYNVMVDMCNFAMFKKSMQVFGSVLSMLQDGSTGNLTLSCPLKKGIYSLKNFRIPDNSPVMKFIFAPNSIYKWSGLQSWTFPNGSKVLMHDYNITFSIVRKCHSEGRA